MLVFGLWIFIWLVLFEQEATSAPFVLELESGRLDWHAGRISAQGQGFPPDNVLDAQQAEDMALRQALVRARQDLWRSLQAVRIHQDLTLEELLQEDQQLKARLQGLVHNAQLIDKTEFGEHGVLVSIGLDLMGDFSRLVIPDSVWFQNSGALDADLDSNSQEPASLLAWQEQKGRAESFTGMLIEARGLHVEPALICTVKDEHGNLVYGPGLVDPEAALKRGMAIFVQVPVSRADYLQRLGLNPIRVRAKDVGSTTGCDLIISAEQAALLRQKTVSALEFLEECRVAIILDPPPDEDLQEYRLLDR